MARDYVFASESVTEGHPDKLCDRISDAILDAHFAAYIAAGGDPRGPGPDGRDVAGPQAPRVAVEAVAKTGFVVVAGEVTSAAQLDVPALVRRTIQDIGYTSSAMGFDGGSCGVLVAIEQQAPEIALEVGRGGAGDQGMMFGYACKETEELMPAPISWAHKLAKRLADVRKSGELAWLRPDGKAQVAMEYRDGVPHRFTSVVLSSQHDDAISLENVRKTLEEAVIRQILPAAHLDDRTQILVNPAGSFVQGGPHADTGLTGRKIIVDTYGGMGRHGGGAFSGKDPTKVDRSAAYMARYVAKNVVAAGLAERCEVQVAYAIGVPEPVSIHVDTFGTESCPPEKIEKAIGEVFDLTPRGIIHSLALLQPIYSPTAAYGHFGREEPGFAWELTDRVEALRDAAGCRQSVTG